MGDKMKNIYKYKYWIIGVLAGSFLLFCYMTLLPHNKTHIMKFDGEAKNVEAIKSESNDSDDDFQNLYSFVVKINNKVVKVPTQLNGFLEDGWKSTKEIGNDTFEFVPIEHMEFTKNDVSLMAMIESTEVYPLTMDKYYISSVLLFADYYPNDTVELPKGIVLSKSSKNDILNAYGDPDDIWTYEDGLEMLFYKYDKNQIIVLSVNEDDKLSEIVLTYEKEIIPLDYSLIDDNKVHLEELPDKFSGDVFELDNVMYNLPDKAKRLLDHGWKPINAPELVPDGADEKIILIMKKDNQSISVELRNPYDYPANIEDCYIFSITFELSDEVDFEFAGGYNALSTLDDFRKLENDFQVKEVYVDMGMDSDVMLAYRIKTGISSQFEVLMDFEGNNKIRGFRLSNYPKQSKNAAHLGSILSQFYLDNFWYIIHSRLNF